MKLIGNGLNFSSAGDGIGIISRNGNVDTRIDIIFRNDIGDNYIIHIDIIDNNNAIGIFDSNGIFGSNVIVGI